MSDLQKRKEELLEELGDIEAQILAEKIRKEMHWCRSGILTYKTGGAKPDPIYERAWVYLVNDKISFTAKHVRMEMWETGYYDGDHTWMEDQVIYTFTQEREPE